MVYLWRPDERIGFNCALSVLGKCLGTEPANRSLVFRVPRAMMLGGGDCSLGSVL